MVPSADKRPAVGPAEGKSPPPKKTRPTALTVNHQARTQLFEESYVRQKIQKLHDCEVLKIKLKMSQRELLGKEIEALNDVVKLHADHLKTVDGWIEKAEMVAQSSKEVSDFGNDDDSVAIQIKVDLDVTTVKEKLAKQVKEHAALNAKTQSEIDAIEASAIEDVDNHKVKRKELHAKFYQEAHEAIERQQERTEKIRRMTAELKLLREEEEAEREGGGGE